MSTPVGAHRAISPESLMQRIYAWKERVCNTTFIHADFELTMANAAKGDLVYCDPPYEYTQRILYGAQDFSLERLWIAIERCKSRGAKVALSLDGKKKSGTVTLKFNIPQGLFEREVSIDCGSSMLRRFQKKDSLCQAFLGPMWSKRKNEAGEVEKCLQLGMSQCTTPLTAVKPLRFP